MDEINKRVSLSVCGSIFVVSKNLLANRCAYFNSLLKGPFRESSQKVIELKGIPSREAFIAFLKYLENGKIPMVNDPKLLLDFVAIVDMFSIDDYFEDMQLQVSVNWPNTTDVELYLELTDRLEVTNIVTESVFKCACNVLVKLGKHTAAICGIKCETACPRDLWKWNPNVKRNCVKKLYSIAPILEVLMSRTTFKSYYKYNESEYFFIGLVCAVTESDDKHDLNFLFPCLYPHLFKKLFVKSVIKAMRQTLRDTSELENSVLSIRKQTRVGIGRVLGTLFVCLNVNGKLIAKEFDSETWKWETLIKVSGLMMTKTAISEMGLYVASGRSITKYKFHCKEGKYPKTSSEDESRTKHCKEDGSKPGQDEFKCQEEKFEKKSSEDDMKIRQDKFTITCFHSLLIIGRIMERIWGVDVYDAVMHGRMVWFVMFSEHGRFMEIRLQAWDSATDIYRRSKCIVIKPEILWNQKTCKLVVAGNILYGFVCYSYSFSTCSRFLRYFSLDLVSNEEQDTRPHKMEVEFTFNCELESVSLCKAGIILLSIQDQQFVVELFKPEDNFLYFLGFLPAFNYRDSAFQISSISRLNYDYLESLSFVDDSEVTNYVLRIQECITEREKCTSCTSCRI